MSNYTHETVPTQFVEAEGEDEAAFQARAHAEARAADPRPVQILIFSDKEISQ
jgi:hypothetical protein